MHSLRPIHHCFKGLFNQLSNPQSILASVTAGTRSEARVWCFDLNIYLFLHLGKMLVSVVLACIKRWKPYKHKPLTLYNCKKLPYTLCRSKNSETTKHVKIYQVLLLVITYRYLYCDENYGSMRWLRCDDHCFQTMDNVRARYYLCNLFSSVILQQIYKAKYYS